VVLAGAALFTHSLLNARVIDPGFPTAGLVDAAVDLQSRQLSPEASAAFFDRLLERARALPGVRDAALAELVPLGGSNMEVVGYVEGAPDPRRPDGRRNIYFNTVSDGYFATMGIPLKAGRDFTEADGVAGPDPALVNEAFARREFPHESPIGKRVRRGSEADRAWTIVGVVGEVRHDGLDRPPRAEIFIPHAQAPFAAMTFVARVAGDPRAMLPMLKAQVHAVDPGQAIYRIATADELVSKSLLERRFTLTLLAGFALLAMVLAATGIYGVISLATTQRTRELGVRLALGADRREILGMVLRQGLALTVVGVAIGLVAALAGARALAGFLYGVAPNDPFTLGAVALGLMLVAMIACALPARRATRVDPLTALRAE